MAPAPPRGNPGELPTPAGKGTALESSSSSQELQMESSRQRAPRFPASLYQTQKTQDTGPIPFLSLPRDTQPRFYSVVPEGASKDTGQTGKRWNEMGLPCPSPSQGVTSKPKASTMAMVATLSASLGGDSCALICFRSQVKSLVYRVLARASLRAP